MGFMSNSNLPLAYGACDASLIPTAKLECFGLIALEALACGKSTLVTPIGALPEVMSDFQKEWIVRDVLVQGIADLLSAFLDKRLSSSLLSDIRAVIERKYSFKSALLAYERLLSGEL
jgi:glycosyltransferase involved in cell wall biosynthesis